MWSSNYLSIFSISFSIIFNFPTWYRRGRHPGASSRYYPCLTFCSSHWCSLAVFLTILHSCNIGSITLDSYHSFMLSTLCMLLSSTQPEPDNELPENSSSTLSAPRHASPQFLPPPLGYPSAPPYEGFHPPAVYIF